MLEQMELRYRGFVSPDTGRLALRGTDLEGWDTRNAIFAGREVDVIVRVHNERASKAQVGYYRAVILPFVSWHLRNTLGYPHFDEARAHDWIKREFNRVCTLPAEAVTVRPGSTVQVSKAAFNELIVKLDTFSLDYFGVGLPDTEAGARIMYSGER